MRRFLLVLCCCATAGAWAGDYNPNDHGYLVDVLKIAKARRMAGVQRYLDTQGKHEADSWVDRALALEHDGSGSPAAILELYEKAAAAGNPRALWALGEICMQGKLVPRDENTGLSLLTMASEAGVPDAQYDLGYIYANGVGVAADGARAEAEYRKAADSGMLKARVNLALLLAAHAEHDAWERAYVLMRQAERQGFAGAAGHLSAIAAKLSPEERARADQLALAAPN